jgi:tRNA A-37 threonylcarbamoyl transferase component Bud32
VPDRTPPSPKDWLVPLSAPAPIPVVELPSLPKSSGLFVVHPRYRQWLAKCGLTSAEAMLALKGEVVGGHANRHVRIVSLNSGNIERQAYLKREHRVGWRVRLKNRLDGFGAVSRSEREAMMLGELEKAGLPAPQWLAYGEDESGKAFLLVEELPTAMSLTEYLHEYRLDDADKRTLCERLGRFLADFHNSGFSNPDIAAKHLLIQPGSQNLTLIDWPSAPMPSRNLKSETCLKDLAKLNATIPETVFKTRDRLRVFWAYRRTRSYGKALPRQRFAEMVQHVQNRSSGFRTKSSVNLQQSLCEPQRLVWVADDAVVAVPEVAELWPNPAVGMPFYLPAGVPFTGQETLLTPDGQRATLLRYRTRDPLGRLLTTLRERNWLAPACAQARTLLQLARYGVLAPRLLAFGQQITGWAAADSFLLMTSTNSLSGWNELKQDPRWCLQLGAYTRQLHDAGFRWNREAVSTSAQPLVGETEDTTSLQLTSPELVSRCKQVRKDQAEQNLLEVAMLLAPHARQLVLNGYHQGLAMEHPARVEAAA